MRLLAAPKASLPSAVGALFADAAARGPGQGHKAHRRKRATAETSQQKEIQQAIRTAECALL